MGWLGQSASSDFEGVREGGNKERNKGATRRNFLQDFAAMDRQQLDRLYDISAKSGGNDGIKWSTRDKGSFSPGSFMRFRASLSRSAPGIVATTTDNPHLSVHFNYSRPRSFASRRLCLRSVLTNAGVFAKTRRGWLIRKVPAHNARATFVPLSSVGRLGEAPWDRRIGSQGK